MNQVIWVIKSIVIIGVILYFPLGFNNSQENQLSFGDYEWVILKQSDPEKIFVNGHVTDGNHLKIIDPWTMKEETRLDFYGSPYYETATRVGNEFILVIYRGWSEKTKKVVLGLQKKDIITSEVLASIEVGAGAASVYWLDSLEYCSDYLYIPVFLKKIDEWHIYKLRIDDLSFVDKLSFKKGESIWYFLDYALNAEGTKLYILKSYLTDADDEQSKKYHVQVYETSNLKLVSEFDVDDKVFFIKLNSDGLLYVYPRGGNHKITIYETRYGKVVREIEFPETESIHWLDDSSPNGKIYFLTNTWVKDKGLDPTQAKIYEVDLTDFSTVIYPVNATLKAYKPLSSFLFKVDRHISPTLVFKKNDRIRVCFVEGINIKSDIFNYMSNKDTIHYYDVELN